MNYYFLLEDEKSLLKVLPEWLKHLGMSAVRVPDISFVKNNNYVLQSGHGVTQLITKVLFETIDTIIENRDKIDWLIVVIDSEEYDASYRKEEVETIIKQYATSKQLTYTFQVKVVVCNHCFETWLLGNEEVYPMDPPEKDNFFYQYYNEYNVAQDDPELMGVPIHRQETIAEYHFQYLHDAFRYQKIRFRKNKPDYVATREYFDGMTKRSQYTNHLQSFLDFIRFITSLNEEANN